MWSRGEAKNAIFLCACLASSVLVASAAADGIDCPSSTSYLCQDGKTCIDKQYLCNHVMDCPDRDDETDCDMKQCKDDKFFRCRTGDKCISKSLTCDQVADCEDASDESDALCEGHPPDHVNKPCDLKKEFECEAKICIPIGLVCDGTKHCFDGRDEETEMCKKSYSEKNTTCPGFLCDDNKQCLSSHSWVCDGFKDCTDGSDELHCTPHCEISSGGFLCKDETECIKLEKVCDGASDCDDKSDEGGSCNSKDACKSMSCEGPCLLLPTGATCQCAKGLSYNNNTKKCEDANECDRFGVCSQGCVNTNGTHYCTCAKGFKLKNDQRTCAVYGKEPLLVYTSPKKIKTIGLHSSFSAEVQKTKQAIGVTYDGRDFYWTEMSSGKEAIVKFAQGAKTTEVLLTAGVGKPEDIAIDWLTGNLYFTDAELTHIAVCTGNGFHCTQLLQSDAMDKPRAIALHPAESLMFWTDWGRSPHIGVAFMDGSRADILVKDVTWPNGFTLDWPNGRIYWADAFTGIIESATINGKDRRQVLNDFVHHPFGLAVFESRIYWSDWQTFSIESCDKFTGKDHDVLVQGEEILDVHIYHDAMMPQQKHACMNNECSHMCLLSSNSTYTCACPETMALLPDKHTCFLTGKQYNIILGIGKYIVSIPHQTFGRHMSSFAENVGHNIDRLEFNSLNGEVFVAENTQRKIVTVDMERRVTNDVVSSHVFNVASMGFDYLANNLYWVDSIKGTIEVFSLKRKTRAILQHYTGTDVPSALALAPLQGEMFVVLKSPDHYHIDRLAMKGGTDHDHVIETGLSSKGPIHIAVDEVKKILYWSDGQGRRIERSNFDGTNRESFFTSKRGPGPIAIINDDIIWTSLKSGKLQWVNTMNSTGRKIVSIEPPTGEKNLPDFITIAAGTPMRSTNHQCMQGNGGCSDVCVSDGPSSRVCLCETGHFFKGNKNTICVKRNDCGFVCAQSGECLDASQRCDGKIDCLDNSDEHCEDVKNKLKCDASEFMCQNGQKCIHESQRCDQHFNCDDKSDEAGCEDETKSEKCRDDQMRCPKGFCLDLTQRCDGIDDCQDGFDENKTLCATVDCPADFFKCVSGQCFPQRFVCNMHIDCVDGSDEHAECPIPICKAPKRPCTNGWCISEKMFCDGHDDCEDGSDERGCAPLLQEGSNTTCTSDEFQCTSEAGKCITDEQRCDGHADCLKGEDEKDCPNCPLSMFECANDKCIPSNHVCDTHDDCGDESDEENCGKPRVSSQSCEADEFKCTDGTCLSYDKVCDKVKHCRDGDDEGGVCQTACDNNKCEQHCVPSPKGFKCACHEGFKLGSVGDKSCVDIDECQTLNPCSQECTNYIGSFRCKCTDGYILGADKTSCKAKGSSEMLLFSFHDQIRHFKELERATDVVVDTNDFAINDFAVDVKNQKFLVVAAGDEELMELSMKSDSKSLMEIPAAHRIAYDWISGNTYITHYPDDKFAEIHVCNMKTKGCALIRKLAYHEHIPAIEVDPINKLVFYVKIVNTVFVHPSSSIVKMRLDGSHPETILNDTHISTMALDIDQQRIYFTEFESQSLQAIDYSGGNKVIITKQTRLLKRPIAMTIFESHAYVLNQLSNQMARCKLYGNFECRQVDIMTSNAKRITVAQESTQKEAPNNCLGNKCDVICVNADVGIKCLCSNGTSVGPDAICSAKAQAVDESGFTFWTFMILIMFAAAIVGCVYVCCRRRHSRGSLNISMYFRNNEFGKAFPQNMKPTPLPRTAIPQASAPTVNTLTRDSHEIHEIINDDFRHYTSAATLNTASSSAAMNFSDDENEEMYHGDYSNDPHQRLII